MLIRAIPMSFKCYHHLEGKASPQCLTHLQIWSFLKSLMKLTKGSYALSLWRHWIHSRIMTSIQALIALSTPLPPKIQFLKGKIFHVWKIEATWDRGHLMTKSTIFSSPSLLMITTKKTISSKIQGCWHPDKCLIILVLHLMWQSFNWVGKLHKKLRGFFLSN